MPILVFLGLSVLELGPIYVTDRQTNVRQKRRLMPSPYGSGGIIIQLIMYRLLLGLHYREVLHHRLLTRGLAVTLFSCYGALKGKGKGAYT